MWEKELAQIGGNEYLRRIRRIRVFLLHPAKILYDA
mgnify:CR=1 FL=1